MRGSPGIENCGSTTFKSLRSVIGSLGTNSLVPSVASGSSTPLAGLCVGSFISAPPPHHARLVCPQFDQRATRLAGIERFEVLGIVQVRRSRAALLQRIVRL